MDGEKLNKEGLKKVWLKFWSLLKVIVGDVDVEGKGDLQTQVNSIEKNLPGVVSKTKNGLMTAVDKKKLDGIDEDANAYTHPQTHSASMIEQDAERRFVSDIEKNAWNNKLNMADVIQSPAVTIPGQKALDAIEKNASVPGTMAYDLAQVNSNFADKNAANIFTNTQSINKGSIINGNMFFGAALVINANTGATGNVACIGFHNSGVVGAGLYLNTDRRFKIIYNEGQINTLAYTSELPNLSSISVSLVTENISSYGISVPGVECKTYGKICAVNFRFGINGGLGAWEVKTMATGLPHPAGSTGEYCCHPVVADGKGLAPTVTVNLDGNLQVQGQVQPFTGDNWLIGTLVYLII